MVYISKLKKEIWPLYIPPLPNEIFSSWLFRFTSNHNIDSKTFLNNNLDKKLFFGNNDIDITAEPSIITFLSEHTPLHPNEIKDLFLDAYDSYAIENGSYEQISKSIQFIQIKKNKLQFCPSCLSKKKAYFKKNWRLSTSIICCECNSYLIDYCPGCHNSIPLWSSSINFNSNIVSSNISISICKCGYNISTFSNVLKPTELEIEYQNYINSTISNGFNNHSQYSFTYLNVLVLVAFKIKKMKNSVRHKKKLKKIYPYPIFEINEPFSKWNLPQRKHLLPIAYYLLKNYPNHIKSIFPKENKSRAEFDQPPYWFEKELIFR